MDSRKYASFSISFRRELAGQIEDWKRAARGRGRSLAEWTQESLNQAARAPALSAAARTREAEAHAAGRALGIWLGWFDLAFQLENPTLIPIEELRAWLRSHPSAITEIQLWMVRQVWYPTARLWWEGQQLPKLPK